MFQGNVTVKNEIGLHSRPAARVVFESAKYKSNITLRKGEKKGNMKSLLSVLSVGALCGDELIVEAEGEDEVEAVEAVIKLIGALEE